MPKFKNTILQLKMLWYVVFLLALSLNVHAGNEEIVSLFTPAASRNLTSDDAVFDVAMSDSQQEVIINLIPLKSEIEAYEKVRMDFLEHSIVVRRTAFLRGLKESVTWIGKPEGREGSIIMSVCGDALFGQIELKDEVYKIEPVRGSNTHRVFKLDPENAAPIDDGGSIPHYDKLNDKEIKDSSASEKKDDGSVFDVLVFYTNGFAEAYPGDVLIAQISYLAGVANASYLNSEIGLTARVVGTEEVDYEDSGTTADALSDLTSGSGVFSDVAALRNRLGADLVVLLRVYTTGNEACGRGWQMTSLSSSFEKWAFSVVQVGRISFGSSYTYCTDQTLSHEMGHNMGCGHDDAYSATGIFKYSYGYCFYPYRSVMATCSGTRVSHFSKPDLSYEGFATGTEDANNARSINRVKLTVSQFRDSKCLGLIIVSPGKLTLAREEGSEVTVTVTGEYDAPSEGETINVTVNKAGRKQVSVSPSRGITDINGQATFTITAKKKKGTAKVKFKVGCLKKSMTVKVN